MSSAHADGLPGIVPEPDSLLDVSAWLSQHGPVSSNLANPSLRELKNAVPLVENMGLSMTTVQRMLGASLVASLGVWFLQGAVMDAVLTFIALSALTAVWRFRNGRPRSLTST